MAKQKKITISFSQEYMDVYDFLKVQKNASRYVCKAIREKIDGNVNVDNVVARMLGQKPEVGKDDLKKAVDSFEF